MIFVNDIMTGGVFSHVQLLKIYGNVLLRITTNTTKMEEASGRGRK
jgi:hypothetical protein